MQNNSLMEIVATHGTGNDILALAQLLKANNAINVPHTPLMKIQHLRDCNVYDCVGFTPPDVFQSLQDISNEIPDGSMITQVMEKVLQDPILVERMACLMIMLTQSLPGPMLSLALGGSSR